FSYHLEKGEIEYLNASWDEALSTFDESLEHINSLLDRCKVNEYKVTLYRMKNDLESSLYLGVQTLDLLGINLKAFPEEDELIAEVNHANETIAARKIENFIDLPEMQDPEKLAAMVLLRECVPPSYFLGSRLLFILGIKMIELSLTYGNNPHSSVGYVYYSLTLAFVAQDFEAAYKFGSLALRLNDDKYQMKRYEALILNMWGGFVSHYTEHLDRSKEHLMRGYYSGVENGAYQWAGYCAINFLFMCFWGTDSLKELSEKIDKIIPGLKKVDPNMVQYYYAIKATIYNLTEPVEDWSVLDESLWPNAKEIIKSCLEKNDLFTVFLELACKLSLANWYSDSEKAIDYANSAEKYLIGATGIFINPAFHFHQCLALSVGYDYADGEKQAQYVEKIKSNLEKFKLWSKHCPSTYLHQRLLIEAELARITGNALEAQDLYDQAIESARENKFLQNEALASELAAKFWLGKGKEKIAKVYMSEAHYGYQRWGATAKVNDLDTRYPQLLQRKPSNRGTLSTTISMPPTTTGRSTSSDLDLTTVLKASQTLSEEIVLDKLLAKLMQIIIENAGAQKGFLILETKGKLLIEAEGSVDKDGVTVLQSIPIKSVGEPGDKLLISHIIVNYVARTRESVVLSDAANDPQFANSPYIRVHKPKSILCFPLQHQGKLAGIIYLENNLTTEAFTSDRVELLNLLSSQAAISIENARFYNNLTELNQAFERFVPRQFLQFLDKESIIDVKVGDQVQQEMSVLFSDIRDFTTLSESMTPQDNFTFINSYLSHMEPAITENQGFIDKYIGDAIMALFSGEADNAVKAGIDMLHRLTEYNQHRTASGYVPIKIGIGINTGSLILGMVGGRNRMDSTVISDAVNLASRIESLTKQYGISMLISHHTFQSLQDSNQYAIRLIDRVKVKGKSKAVSMFEVFDADPPETYEGKVATRTLFEEALILYHLQKLRDAERLFAECLRRNPTDKAAHIYQQRCTQPDRD
ncbi:adenylate/guanylate cyclase domain-containing protein, partial [Microcoleus sp. LAD1_D3]|uniref:adenylate/guanylate cyclase domain-containing protein n=1 Tax=Microcoleus sp. LAD1_D3 TaxID=2819365 RepID=UPI002FD31EFA